MNSHPRKIALLTALLLMPLAAHSQQPKSDPVALPQPVVPAAPAPAVAQPPAAEPAAPLPKTAAQQPASAAKPAGKGGVLLNFQNASLTDVLNNLSEAAGFIVVQETPVTGTVNVTSRQEVSPEEAVDLVNAVLIEKGFIAIRNGRILKIVPRANAQKRDLPVHTGSDPEQIPRKDEMVTQILPLRYGEAAKLVENLQSLLSENATISANESANSILLTDTQTNIRRIATIIRAIDTSVASISTIHVYPLRFADAKELATIVTQLFQVNSSGSSSSGRSRGGDRGGGPSGGFSGLAAMFGGGGSSSTGQSEARQAASRIVAVADEQSNSLIVSAPEDLIPQITEVVEKLDTSIDAVTETRIFRLQHADATELAETLTKIYATDSSTNSSSQGRNSQRRESGRGGFSGFFGGFSGQPQGSGNEQSGRALLQAKVVAVGDPRTNSLVVTAARDTMTQIAETVGRLDATDAKKQRVYVHSLEHADVEGVANVLRGMLGDQTAINNTQNPNRLQNRSTSGAEIDTSDISSGGGGGRAGR